jgi:CubicO group peptidase (beta-lactamase class C family)
MRDSLLKEIQRRSEESLSDAVYITQEDQVLLDWVSQPDLPLLEIMSIGKSIVALAVGTLIDEGKIPSVDMPIYHLYPEWYQGEKEKITLRMVMNHTSGLQVIPEGNEISRAPDCIQLALCAELSDSPGQRFFYNNKAVNILSGVIYRVTGQPVDDYVKYKLFEPLGIKEFGWNRDKAGNPRSSGGVQMRIKDLHKLAQLVMNRGKWQGKRIISESWLKEMLTPCVESQYKCGLLWWIYTNPQVYAAQGYLGQWLYILPEKKIIAIRQIRSDKLPFSQVDEYKDFKELVCQL